uniref:Uncharacterized protein n=1 Tax=Pithovirus LCPAC304 TaxID=2506594 RepID=A0A481ZA57_9VIRU|nr:MAG: hypothetical protein LCPAC304_03870 [Pithovirus LCPAC304]
MDYEAVISQLQPLSDKVLCVEDGFKLRIFEESGPFPFGLVFEHKQKRWGMTEYIFRYAVETEEETMMCVFGRDNAEIFCPDYVDDQNTSSEEDLSQQSLETEEELYSDIFSTSEEEKLTDSPSSNSPTCQEKDLSPEEHEEPILSPPIHVVSIDSEPLYRNLLEKTYDLF